MSYEPWKDINKCDPPLDIQVLATDGKEAWTATRFKLLNNYFFLPDLTSFQEIEATHWTYLPPLPRI